MALSATSKSTNNRSTTTPSEKPKQPTHKLPEKSKYIPPHLRGKGKGTKTSTHTTSIKRDEQKHQHNPYKPKPHNNHINPYSQPPTPNPPFTWYTNEKQFESALGMSLKSFKLNIGSYRDYKQLNELTNINKATKHLSNPIILFVIGPPSVGKSRISKSYLNAFDIRKINIVNTDGDLVRQCHYGIQRYLQLINKLNIGYNNFFRYYCQKWSSNWKYKIREQSMKCKQNIIAYSTCHKYNECINEIKEFYGNGYNIKILFVFGEYYKCEEYGVKRERENGRKYLNGGYCKSMKGSMDFVDYLIGNKMINQWKDLIIVKNKFKKNDSGEVMNGEWRNVKNSVLIPMRKRAIRSMDKNRM